MRASADAPSTTAYVCTWLYADSPAEEADHYQVRGSSASGRFQAVYWRSVALLFATSRRQGSSARHVLFTNTDSLPEVDGVSMSDLLESLEVEVVQLPLTYRTPEGYYHAWGNQFYVFDILECLHERLGDDGAAVVLDSDCVLVSSVDPMIEALRRDGVLTYVVTYDPDWKNNGLSRRDMASIASDLLGTTVEHPLVYCGGELLAVTGRELRRLVPEARSVWQELMMRHEVGSAVFNEEGQTLSYLYFKLGYPIGNGDPFIRRIFTDSLRSSSNNTSRHDHGLVVWHVPLEKRLGIRRLYRDVVQGSSPLWTLAPGPELRRYLGSALGVPQSSIEKRARDLARRGSDRLI